MKAYLLSLLAGGLVGVVYSLLAVRSPAPPVVALVGLLGMLGGEQIVPAARRLIADFGTPAKKHAAPHPDAQGPSVCDRTGGSR